MRIRKRVVIETLPCPECQCPNRVTHDYELLKIEGSCTGCGRRVVFTTDRPLRVISAPTKI